MNQAIFKYAALLAARKIPYAAIYGNHDDEGSISRQASTDLQQTLPYSLTQPGPNTIPGVGNYYIRVLSHLGSHAALTLYFLDTHSYSPDDKKYHGYDWIKPEQIKWFKDTAASLKADNAKYSHIHLDMAFIHIPLPEYRDPGITVGTYKEPPTAPNYNSGFRDALVEMGIPVVSCGHDHANDYCLLSDNKEVPLKARQDSPPSEPEKPANIIEPEADAPKPSPSPIPKHPTTPKPKNDKLWLCYGGGVGFGGYGGYDGYVRRIRFFEFDANEAKISTWKRVEAGETGRRIDEQIIVNGGRVMSE
jgi:3',5'-cyclic AMP phosphodiesterase CpdA